MIIDIEYNDCDETLGLIDILEARYLSDYKIQIIFSDGLEKIIDFKMFLSNSLHPDIKKYLDKDVFSQFSVLDGNLNWNDYDLIFPVADLYEGNL